MGDVLALPHPSTPPQTSLISYRPDSLSSRLSSPRSPAPRGLFGSQSQSLSHRRQRFGNVLDRLLDSTHNLPVSRPHHLRHSN